MKTHFQFILMNWNITSPKNQLSETTYLRDISKGNIQVMIKEIVSLNLCNVWRWNRITTTTVILLIFTIPIARIEILRSEVAPSASKGTFLMSVNFKLIFQKRPISVVNAAVNLNQNYCLFIIDWPMSLFTEL